MDNLSNRQLHLAYWLTSHKELIRRILIYLLIIINIGLFTISIFGLFSIIKEKKNFTQTLEYLTGQSYNPVNLHQASAPQALEIGETTSLINQTNQTIDLVTEITNTNPDWAVTNFKYFFVAGQEAESFILPGQTKFLVQLGLKDQTGALPLTLTSLTWRKITNDFTVPTTNFIIEETKFANESKNNLKIARLTAQVTNQSIYNFWSVPFICLLYSGRKIINVNYVTLDQFQSLQTRQLTASWEGQVINPSTMVIVPDINLFNRDNFWQPETGSGEIK